VGSKCGVSYRTARARYDEEADGATAEAPVDVCDASANARRRGDAAAAVAYDSLAACGENSEAVGGSQWSSKPAGWFTEPVE
jgi:hypothetical protein